MLHAQARGFLRVSECIREPSSAGRLLLQINAIELALKSWLLDHAKSESDLFRLQHDLIKIVQIAKELGLVF
jgi:hypothetical protein